MKKGFLTFLACLAIVLGLIPITTSAVQLYSVPPYPIWEKMVAGTYYGYYPYYAYDYRTNYNQEIAPVSRPVVISPNGGEFWRVGESRQISWGAGCSNGASSCGYRYDLYLISAGCSHPASCNVSPIPMAKGLNTLYGTWLVGTDINESIRVGTFKFAVCTEGSLSNCDAGDASFTVDNSRGYYAPSSVNPIYNYYSPQISSEISPPEGTLLESSSYFSWSPVPSALEYWIQVGTSIGAQNIYNQTAGIYTSVVVSGIPQNGESIYVRIWHRLGNQWYFRDFAYRTKNGGGTVGGILNINPLPGSEIGPSSNFSWTAIPGVTEYWVSLGTTPGGAELYNAVNYSSRVSISNIPTNGKTLYLRVWYLSGLAWRHDDFTYKASGGSSTTTSGTSFSVLLRSSLSLGQTIKAPAVVPVEAIVTTKDSTVSLVQFFMDGQSLGTVLSSPFNLTVTNITSGTHFITAVVTDNKGNQIVSSPIKVEVTP